MDISSLSTEKADGGAEMKLVHPIDGTPITDSDDNESSIVLYGMDSKVYAMAVRKRANKKMVRNKRAKRTDYGEIVDEGRQLVAACIKEVRHVEYEGELLSNDADFIEVFAKLPWLYEQCDQFIHERANFLD